MEYISRDFALDVVKRTSGDYAAAFAEIAHAPAADVVPVVRCRECKHYKEFRTRKNKQIMRLCYRMGKHDMEYPVRPDDFCSYGERSTNTSTEK